MHTLRRLSAACLATLTLLPTTAASAGDVGGGGDDPGAMREGAVTSWSAPVQGVERRSGSITSRIRALTGGGSDPWDVAVSGELVSAYDADHSGKLDGNAEIDAVPCDVWSAIDAGVMSGWGRGVWVIYGFAPDRAWVGDALRIAEPMRGRAASRIRGCGLAKDGPAAPPTASQLTARVEALPAGGSDPWDAAVRSLLLAVHDADHSGAIDAAAEVDAIDCATWKAIDDGVKRGWQSGVYVTYGFTPPMLYLGDALGVSTGMRESAAAALTRCGLKAEPSTSTLTPNGAEVFQLVLAQVPASAPGWDEFVRAMFVRLYDKDGDAQLDEPDEARAVGCDVWRSLDEVVERDRGLRLYDAYGFDPDAQWEGHKLGVPGALRAIVADELLRCGVGPKGTAVDFVAGGSAPTLAAPLSAYDKDASGRIDTVAELRSVPCEAWKRVEDASRREVGLGLVDRYGLRRGELWTADAIGLSPSLRQAARRAVEACVGK